MNHTSAVVSIDSNYELDLHITASAKECVVRVSSTRRFYRRIQPRLVYNVAQHRIHSVLLSERGYVVFHLKNTYAGCNCDVLSVYSVNAELICYKAMDESVNAALFDRTQYFLVVFKER